MGTKERFWLHVGPGKTGTTTIQRAFHASRKSLLDKGICYPHVPRNPHHDARFAHHFLGHALRADDFALISMFLGKIPEVDDVVISSETLPNVPEPAYRTLEGLLAERFDVGVIYYVRDPVDRGDSLAQQMIKAGKRSLEDLNQRPPTGAFRRQIETLVRVFGKERLHLRNFSRQALVEGDLLTDFTTVIGRPEIVSDLPRENWNQSITLEAAQKIEAYRQDTGDTSFINERDTRFHGGSTKFSLTDEAKQRIRERMRDDLNWLETEFGISF
ncbi:MAG: hypothetical protein AAGF79_00925 [Pseudomonadota bacterium]